eukprot:gene18601-25115_t
MEAGNKQKVKDMFHKMQRKSVEQWLGHSIEVEAHAKGLSHEALKVLVSFGPVAPVEADMELDGDEDAAPPAPPPPPPPSAPGKAARKETAPSFSTTQQVKTDSRAVEGKVAELEKALAEKDSKLKAMEAKVKALEASLAMSKNSKGAAAKAADGEEAAALSNPLVVCTCASLAVFLAAQPYGARQSELTSYILKLASANGTCAVAMTEAEDYVTQALSSSPGVFSRSGRPGSEPVWTLSALHALQGLKTP